MPAILSRLSIPFINYTLCDLDNTKLLLYKLFIRYLVVKPACVNAALDTKETRYVQIVHDGQDRLRVGDVLPFNAWLCVLIPNRVRLK